MDNKEKSQLESTVEQAGDQEMNPEGTDNESNIVSFKKVMRGYNPAEVNEYIDMLNANLAGAQQVFDEQSTELKDSIAFVSRERDRLKAEKAEIIEKAAAYDRKCLDLKAALDELDSLKSRNAQLMENAGVADPKYAQTLTEENDQLKSKIETVAAELDSAEKKKNELAEEVASLSDTNAKLSHEIAKLRDSNKKQESEINSLNEMNTVLVNESSALKGANKKQENEIAALKTENKEQEVAFAEFKAAKAKQANELNSVRDLSVRQANEITQLKESHAKQAEEYNKQKNEIEELFTKEQLRLNGEIRQYKLKISDLEAGLKSAQQNQNKMAEEITTLREENTKQAYDFAAQKKETEMQISIERLNRSELLQVQAYNIQKSEELLNEVSKQISQAKESLQQLNAKK